MKKLVKLFEDFCGTPEKPGKCLVAAGSTECNDCPLAAMVLADEPRKGV